MRRWVGVAIVCVYFAGAFLTNSYIRNYRYDEWPEVSAPPRSFLGTVLWPAYAAARASDAVVDSVMSALR